MSRILLLPRACRLIGLLLLPPMLILAYLVLFKDFELEALDLYRRTSPPDLFRSEYENFTNELVIIGSVISLFFLGFARLKTEDEYTHRLRLDALLWAFYLYALFLVVSALFVYSDDYFLVMAVNLALPFVIYVARFYYLLYRSND